MRDSGFKSWGALPSPANASECKEWHNNESQVALPKLLPVTKAIRMRGEREGPSHSKLDGRCVFLSFVQVVHNHLFSCKLFLLSTDTTRTAVKDIYLLISVHSEWRYSLVFTLVSRSRRCWSLDLVRMCLFVMSIFTPTFFFPFSFPMSFFFFFPLFGLRVMITHK